MTKRRIEVKDQKRDKNGRRLCLVCEQPVAKYRRHYCSDECEDRNTPTLMRRRVWKRDGGVCAIRGKRGYAERVGWEMVHIVRVPFTDEGELCGLYQYRTLCVEHSKQATRWRLFTESNGDQNHEPRN